MTPEMFSQLSDDELLEFISHAQAIGTLVEGFEKRFGDDPTSPADLKAERADMYDMSEQTRTALAMARTHAMERGLTEPVHFLDPEFRNE